MSSSAGLPKLAFGNPLPFSARSGGHGLHAACGVFALPLCGVQSKREWILLVFAVLSSLFWPNANPDENRFGVAPGPESEHPHNSLQPFKEGAACGTTPSTCCVGSSVGIIDGAGRLSGLETAEIEAASLVI